MKTVVQAMSIVLVVVGLSVLLVPTVLFAVAKLMFATVLLAAMAVMGLHALLGE